MTLALIAGHIVAARGVPLAVFNDAVRRSNGADGSSGTTGARASTFRRVPAFLVCAEVARYSSGLGVTRSVVYKLILYITTMSEKFALPAVT
jgi:hypothetical protein